MSRRSSLFLSLFAYLTFFCLFFVFCFFYRGNLTLPKIPESNMALSVLGVFLGLLLEVSAHGPSSVPRTSWRNEGTSASN